MKRSLPKGIFLGVMLFILEYALTLIFPSLNASNIIVLLIYYILPGLVAGLLACGIKRGAVAGFLSIVVFYLIFLAIYEVHSYLRQGYCMHETVCLMSTESGSMPSGIWTYFLAYILPVCLSTAAGVLGGFLRRGKVSSSRRKRR